MRKSAGRAAIAFLLFCTVLLPASAAQAQSAAEMKCRGVIAKHLGKFMSAALRDQSVCHSRRSRGRLPLSTNCNDVFSIPKGRSVKVYERASTAMRDACPDDLVDVLARYARCPSPHSVLDDDGATNGIDDFREATDCVLNLAATLLNGASATVSGHPLALPTAGAAKCQRRLGKALRSRIDTIAKVRRICQSDSDRNAGGLGYACTGFDDGKILANQGDLVTAIVKDCSVAPQELAVLGACGQTVPQLLTCTIGIGTVLGGGLAAEAYELPSTCKLGSSFLVLNAAHGARETESSFEIGYNGLGYHGDLLDDFRSAVNLDCNDDCVDCQATLNPLKSQPTSFCRCDSDPTIHCDTIEGPDTNDCGGGQCTCMFGPPQPLSSGGVPVCLVHRFVSDLEGNADGGTGVSTVTLLNTTTVHLGESISAPCPVCDGDLTANDGVRDGTCDGGARDGQPCDANADSPDFGAMSYECLPSDGLNVSDTGLRLKFAITTVESPPMTADLTDGSQPVFCLQCSGDSTIGCHSDADCDEFGAGTCSVTTGPQAAANACSDGICTASGPNADGVCLANAPDLFCDGYTRGDGGGLVRCTGNADCTLVDAECPGGDCGACTLEQDRRCLPNPFAATGSDGAPGTTVSSGAFGADMVATLCIPATGDADVDSSVGLPGPGRIHFSFDFQGRCASDPSVIYQPPGGSNCP